MHLGVYFCNSYGLVLLTLPPVKMGTFSKS